MPQRAYRQLAAYNAWANTRLYDAAERLGDEVCQREGGAFFGSILGTLNHLLVADRIWMNRFEDITVPAIPLDTILFEDVPLLRMARDAEDLRIRTFVDDLTFDRLEGEIGYSNSSGRQFRQTLSSALDHFFNHQTHHRGQVHALVTGLAGRQAAPSLDLIAFQRESGA